MKLKKPKEYVIRARKTENLVNECPKLNCRGKIVLEKFVGVSESNSLNGKRIYIGLCPSCKAQILYNAEIIFDVTKGYVFATSELDGDYRIVKV